MLWETAQSAAQKLLLKTIPPKYSHPDKCRLFAVSDGIGLVCIQLSGTARPNDIQMSSHHHGLLLSCCLLTLMINLRSRPGVALTSLCSSFNTCVMTPTETTTNGVPLATSAS